VRRAGEDARFLEEAVALAEAGRFAVEPNPLVGCVLVRGGRVVGRGRHRAWGGAHAEVEAVADAGRAARGATAYVSLEPCTTTGKTGPCSEALARAGVARVVFAVRDPDPRHGGRAARALRRRGIRCDGPAPSAAAEALLAPFRRALSLRRPWVVAKWAASLDGRTAPRAGAGGRITGTAAERWVHDLRGRVEAVAVGVETVLVDDPRLDCRRPGGPPDGRPQPAAVVFDSTLRLPLDANVVTGASPARRLVVVTTRGHERKAEALRARDGVVVVETSPGPDGRADPVAGLRALRRIGVRRLLVEGGAVLTGALLRRGLVDQVAAFSAPLLLGGDGAPPALAGTGVSDVTLAPRLEHARVRRVGGDVLVEGYVVPAAPRGRRPAARARAGARVSAAARS
jgi:diaminohydroxyphosphoribosylaminopyrimidine deaminase/5-amino-6-(5-phosphoribosylamino)uracil reductase